MQAPVFAVLSQLDRVPLVALFETREANARHIVLFRRQETVKRLPETVGKHLYRGRRYMITVSFECTLKIVLAGKRPVLLILRFEHFKHPVIHGARLNQALHEQTILFLIRKEPVFKRSHSNILPQTVETVKGQRIPVPSRPGRKAQFTPMSEVRGTLAPTLVE